MRCRSHAHLLLSLLATGWSGVCLLEALQRWRFDRICDMTCGPFWPAELVAPLQRAMDWQTPLALAALPLAVVGGWWILSRGGGSMAAPRPR